MHQKKDLYLKGSSYSDVTAFCAEQISRVVNTLSKERFTLAHDAFDVPPDRNLGDLALPCFTISRQLKKSPQEVAALLCQRIECGSLIQNCKNVGPYLNLFLAPEFLATMALSRRGKQKTAKKDRVIIEYVSPNTNKPLHLGHVRNAMLGDSIARLLVACGHTVFKTCLVNDRGIHICKSMLAYLKTCGSRDTAPTPRSSKKKGDHFVGDYYVLFETLVKEKPSLEQEAHQLLAAWEAGDVKTRRMAKQMNAWVLAGMKQTYARLGITFTKTYYESLISDKGRSIVLKFAKKGVVRQEDGGAYYAPLEQFGLPNKILLRKDGTSLYITQDIYLAIQKWKDYKATRSLYVVGSEQNLYFKQLFKTLELFGYPWAGRLAHISYGMVHLPDGRMKSREGTVVDADDLIDGLEALSRAEVRERDAHLPAREVERRARIIALAALKFYMADVSPKSDMTFDPKASVALQGRTGPYILYTYARLKSILKKGRGTKTLLPSLTLQMASDWIAEKPIALALLRFDDMIRNATAAYAPSLITVYLFDLSQLINEYYHTTPVLAANRVVRKARLVFVAACAHALKKGLDLLGIDTLEEM